jgi:hypothetical protein
MRADICAREDLEAQSALLEALGTIGATPEDDVALEVPLPTGLLRFRAGNSVLTLFGDAWGIDLEGPDDLVKRVLAAMAIA